MKPDVQAPHGQAVCFVPAFAIHVSPSGRSTSTPEKVLFGAEGCLYLQEPFLGGVFHFLTCSSVPEVRQHGPKISSTFTNLISSFSPSLRPPLLSLSLSHSLTPSLPYIRMPLIFSGHRELG